MTKTLKILILEDDLVQSIEIEDVYRKACDMMDINCKLFPVSTEDSAIETYTEERPEIVHLNRKIRTNRNAGLEVMKRIRKYESMNHESRCMMIFYTGYPETITGEDISFVEKPYFDQLHETAINCLRAISRKLLSANHS